MVSMVSLVIALIIAGGSAYESLARMGITQSATDTHTAPYVEVWIYCAPQQYGGACFTQTNTITPNTNTPITTTPFSGTETGLWETLVNLGNSVITGINYVNRLTQATTYAMQSIWGIPVFGALLVLFWITCPILFFLRTLIWGGD